MKFRALVMAVVVMAFGAVLANAAPVQVLAVGGGLTMPMGDAADVFGTGFHAGGAYLYKPAAEYGLGVDLSYHMLSEKTIGDSKIKLNAMYAGAQGRYFFPMKDAKFSPYLKVGVGIYNLSAKTTVTDLGEVTVSNSKVGFSGGLGSMFTLNAKSMLGVELVYHQIQTDEKATNLFTGTVTYNFVL